ncbi:MAG: hypothetical protein P1U80_01115 [Pseudomonadales bacterium]|nr:hypothetical protein [Pseudomonadales bacterium]
MHKVNIQTILFYSVIFCTTIVGITSCSDTEKNPVKHSEKPKKTESPVLKQPPLEPPASITAKALDPETPGLKRQEPSKPLDLSLTDSSNETLLLTKASLEEIIVPDLLPDLFSNKPGITKPRLSGRLITDEKKEDPVDSIDGVEIFVDFQIP